MEYGAMTFEMPDKDSEKKYRKELDDTVLANITILDTAEKASRFFRKEIKSLSEPIEFFQSDNDVLISKDISEIYNGIWENVKFSYFELFEDLSETEANELESISSYYLNKKLNIAFSTFKIGNEYYFNEF